MRIKDLSLENVVEVVQSLVDDYGDFISMDCCEEIMDNFYEQWNSCNEHYGLPSILKGMTRDDAYFYNSILESIVKKCIEISLVESEQVPNFV